jgi:nicotinate-nucleotide adenylyltransferase
VLGGTFDPIHEGHLAAGRAAVECARLDRVLLVPAAQPPHRGAAIAPAEHRLAMCGLAAEGDGRFECSDIELERPGPSYTVDTLEELSRREPAAELFLILGWDAARMFHTWHEPVGVRRLASIVIVGRPGSGLPNESELAAAGLGGPGVVVCAVGTPAVSASEIRRDVAAGKPIGGLVPPVVERYIAAHHLYAL